MQNVRKQDHGEEVGQDMVEQIMDSESGPKRKISSPLKELALEEEVGKKQKIDGEVLVLSKLMEQQLGLAVAAGQHRRE